MAGIRIGNNIAGGAPAHRALDSAETALEQSLLRLSSGQRINRAADDAAGLALAEMLNADARIYTVGTRNINDAISLFSVVDGALQQMQGILERIKEVSQQAANGAFDDDQREALNAEATALQAEYNRIRSSTSFNGIDVFATAQLAVAAGYSTIDADVANAVTEVTAETTGDGTFGSSWARTVGGNTAAIVTGDFNGDQKLDLATPLNADWTMRIFLGNGNGTFSEAGTVYATGSLEPRDLAVGDFDENGVLDIVDVGSHPSGDLGIRLGNGNGTFRQYTTMEIAAGSWAMVAGYIDNDSHLDLLTTQYGVDSVTVLLGNGNGTFAVRVSSPMTAGWDPLHSVIGDINGDGRNDAMVALLGAEQLGVLIGNGNGTFEGMRTYAAGIDPGRVAVGHLNNDGILDVVTADRTADRLSVFLGNGNGTFGARVSWFIGDSPVDVKIQDLNGDSRNDLVAFNQLEGSIAFMAGNGDGTFAARVTSRVVGDRLVLADFNADSVLDTAASRWTTGVIYVHLGNSNTVFTASTYLGPRPLTDIDLLTQASALASLATVETYLDELAATRGVAGSSLSRSTTPPVT